MKTKISVLILGLGLVFTLGCSKYPPASDRLLEDLAVITQYDTKVNFNNYKTFSMPDAIMKITDKDTVAIKNQTAITILNQVSKNMTSMGYSQVITPVKPDFAIEVLYYQNTTVYTYNYNWWGYYPYYPYYPVYYASYTTGMGNIELVDLKVVDDPNKRAPIRWNAFIRGILNEGHTTAEITGRIDQAFIQTPQLKTTAK
ncbi:MAG: DUF4136 domain-containing protein [Bacteroidota bacterium]